MKGTLHEDQYTFLITSRSGLKLDMFQTNAVEKIKTHILYSIIYIYIFFSFENRAVYEVMWKKILQRGRKQMAIWRIACWIPKAINTHSEYVILIAFPLQHWF